MWSRLFNVAIAILPVMMQAPMGQAVSNFSTWIPYAPEWLKNPAVDTYGTLICGLLLAARVIHYIRQRKNKPKPLTLRDAALRYHGLSARAIGDYMNFRVQYPKQAIESANLILDGAKKGMIHIVPQKNGTYLVSYEEAARFLKSQGR